jgi:hypothetical protein
MLSNLLFNLLVPSSLILWFCVSIELAYFALFLVVTAKIAQGHYSITWFKIRAEGDSWV